MAEEKTARLRGIFRWLLRHVGRRGVFLMMLGSIYMLLSGSLIDRPPPPQDMPMFEVAIRIMPLAGWGTAALLAGAIAWFYAFVGAGDYHTDAPGFAALMVFSSAWALSFLASFFITGHPAAGRAFLSWLIVTLTLVIVAGWPEAPE